ncbi:CNP1-like family protein [Thiobacter aerophilum]|uniref:CNP1-like family protein n=1 Tax=Thiobacter aerophilum TaxID=3121275 RepID=A0ABV0EII9_9BURK
MRSILLSFCLACLLLAPTAHAAWGEFEYDFDNEKPWVELEAQLPPYPRLEAALPFFVSAATDNRFFIDPQSISVGEDGVVRYALIVISPSGATNITFEGMRCGAHEFKIYAFGRGGQWARNRYAQWKPIEYKDRNRQHHMLYDDFFCPGGIIAKDAPEIVFALKRGIHPRAEQP